MGGRCKTQFLDDPTIHVWDQLTEIPLTTVFTCKSISSPRGDYGNKVCTAWYFEATWVSHMIYKYGATI